MDKDTSNNSFGILPILGIVFITLKLCGVIKWRWLWVLAPFWVDFLLILAVNIIAALPGIKAEHKMRKIRRGNR